MDRAEEERLMSNWRGRRLLTCRTADLMRDIIKSLGNDVEPHSCGSVAPDEVKAEMLNAVTCIQRMILAFNDGGLSPSTLNNF